MEQIDIECTLGVTTESWGSRGKQSGHDSCLVNFVVKDKGSRPNNDFLFKNENYKKGTDTMLRGMYMSRYTYTHTHSEAWCFIHGYILDLYTHI